MKALRSHRWKLGLIAVATLCAGFWFWRAFVLDWIEPDPGGANANDKSTDLPRDLKLMWQTKPLGGTPDPSHGANPRSSTDRAINAASRVFNSVSLVGKTREEVIALLGDSRTSSDSVYNFPFFSAPKGALVYRFDSGSYGWQFNVIFGNDGRVSSIERKWIY